MTEAIWRGLDEKCFRVRNLGVWWSKINCCL